MLAFFINQLFLCVVLVVAACYLDHLKIIDCLKLLTDNNKHLQITYTI